MITKKSVNTVGELKALLNMFVDDCPVNNITFQYKQKNNGYGEIILSEQNEKPEGQLDALEEIKTLTAHNIPYYGYGDNEAACELADRLSKIYKICERKS